MHHGNSRRHDLSLIEQHVVNSTLPPSTSSTLGLPILPQSQGRWILIIQFLGLIMYPGIISLESNADRYFIAMNLFNQKRRSG